MRIDVNAFIGRYPFRDVPGGSPAAVLAAMDRTGIDQAWISNLSALFWRDPSEGNATVYQVSRQHPRFRPVPSLQPEFANRDAVIAEALAQGAPALRVAPTTLGLDPAGAEMRTLVAVCGDAGLPVVLPVRWEDGRQRHRQDTAAELSPAAVRVLIRSHPRVRLLVTHADREFVEQVHFGSTRAEAERLLWDICWIWGPPEDHLALLLRTVGRDRFTFGSGIPLRIPENGVAKLDLLDLPADERAAIESGNLERFLG